MKGAYYFAAPADLRLLFVDDDPILREFAGVHLSGDHVSVETAADGELALQRIAQVLPDLVLLDLEMPNMDGFEVLRRLREDPATARLPVIVVTGREDTGAVDRAFEAGATSFLPKPLNWRLLSYQIRYVHRTAANEGSLLDDRRQALEEGRRNESRLRRLAAEGARFLAAAMKANPELRQDAEAFASAVAEASG